MYAGFSLGNPVLAFSNRKKYDEYFWNGIYALPHLETMKMLEKAKCLQDIPKNHSIYSERRTGYYEYLPSDKLIEK